MTKGLLQRVFWGDGTVLYSVVMVTWIYKCIRMPNEKKSQSYWIIFKFLFSKKFKFTIVTHITQILFELWWGSIPINLSYIEIILNHKCV
jgi:hypothetical protein